MKKRLLFIISFLILLLGHSCKKDNDIFNNEESIQKNRNDNYDNNLSSDGEIVLGRILNDPYKFENMLMARDQLANERSGISTLMVILKEYSVYYKSMNNNPQKHNDVNFATKLYNERKITVYMISFIIMLLLSLHSYKIYVTF